MPRKFIALAAVLALATSARADFTIDDFLSSPQSAAVSGSTGETSSTTAASVLGGSRTLNVNVTQNDLFQSASASVVDAGGQGFFVFSAGALVSASGSIVYDADGAGLGGENLAQYGTDFSVEVVWADLGLTLGIQAIDTDGNAHTVSFLDAADDDGIINFSFADFAAAGVDLASLDSVAIVFDAPTGADFVLNFIGVTDNTPPAVPEPASAAMLGLGAFGLLAVARRRAARA